MGLPASLPGPLPQEAGPATPILSASPLVSFATTRVDPPSIVYVTTDDTLHVALWCSQPNVQVSVTLRLLRADGQIITTTQTLTPPTGSNRFDSFIQLTEGFLLSVAVNTANALIRPGVCWCNLHIATGSGAGALDTQALFSDYVTSGNPVGWPGGKQLSSIEGPGVLTVVSLANPGGGNPYQINPPANTRWRLISAACSITTTAAVANRRIVFQWGTGGAGAGRSWTATDIPASQGVNVWIASYPYQQSDSLILGVSVAIPPYLFLDAFIDAQLGALGMQAGDTFQGFSMLVEQWVATS